MKVQLLGVFLFFVLASSIVIPAYAQSVHRINIPTGSADPNAPFHWQTIKGGDTSGNIQIVVNDSIEWKNGDTVGHTVTSGAPDTEPDGKFDSGTLGPGKTFTFQFLKIGKYPFYCTIHPWRLGLVTVTSGLSVLPNVGSEIGDGMTNFDLEYKFNRIVNTASIDENSKSILFELKGNTNSDDHTLTLLLPSELISGVFSVSIDGTNTENFSQESEDELTKLVIKKIPPFAKEISITGATIIPEFGAVAAMILAVAIISIIAISTKSKLIPLPRF
ncbi:MAG TPA: PEFG-CTERM sorting domain-containing protein [Nitrosopumilaceae archaeon]|nr:PEFG-CTERM sorting domain-containing protein [Nitrosopumilaceae archaeon]